jgi:hypothetical protein
MQQVGTLHLGVVDMKNYGVKLISYAGQEFNAWVFVDSERFSTTDQDEAWVLRKEYELRNPKGFYLVEEIKEG